tara:strand:+ start:251 stop:559 length:309 start_codon:yes stop_codon:yes gene_type:complete
MDLIHQETSGLLVVAVDQVTYQDQTQEELVVDHLLMVVHMLVLVLVDLVLMVLQMIVQMMDKVNMHFKILEVAVVLDQVDVQKCEMVVEDLVLFSSHIPLDK